MRGYRNRSNLVSPSVNKGLDSLSVSQEPENRGYELMRGCRNYKPLVVLNIDIGEPEKAKIVVYDFTDPWKRAYDFITANNLPEEMHEEIALFIQNAKEAKEREIKLHRLAAEKEAQVLAAKHKVVNPLDTFGKFHDMKARTASCELKKSSSIHQLGTGQTISNTNAFKLESERVFGSNNQKATPKVPYYPSSPVNALPNPIFSQIAQGISKKTGLERNNSSDRLHQGGPASQDRVQLRPFQQGVAQALLAEARPRQLPVQQGPKESLPEKSHLLDSTALLSNSGEKNKTRTTLNLSPFDSRMYEASEQDASMRLSHQQQDGRPSESLRPVQHTPEKHKQPVQLEEYASQRPSEAATNKQNEELSSQMPTQDPKLVVSINTTCSADGPNDSRIGKLSKIQQLFKEVDVEGTGRIRTYDFYLADIPTETRNLLHAIFTQHESRVSAEERFPEYDLKTFSQILMDSDSSFLHFPNQQAN